MLHHLMRRDLLELPSPSPLPPVEEIERRLGRPFVKLDANENPYGPSPLVAEALRDCRVERYGDPESTLLRQGLSEYLGVEPDRIACSAGGDEMIDLLMRLFLEPGDEVIDCTPSFVMYALGAAFNAGRLIPVPRDQDFAVDVAAVERSITPRTKVIFLCNPNNPTGNPTPEEDIVRLLETGRMLVLDEAYAEFSGRTHVSLVESYPNLIIARTMSKWAALAGLRLGYGVMHPEVVRHLEKIVSPYHVSVPAQAAGVASLADSEYLMDNVRRILAERDRLHDRLDALPFGRVYPSEANFLYWTTGAVAASALREAMIQRGVQVRAFHVPVDALRVSVGTPGESDILVEALEEAYAQLAG